MDYILFSPLVKASDTFLKFDLPLVVMPPPGVFYPALLATDPVSVDRLAYIMHRWVACFDLSFCSAVDVLSHPHSCLMKEQILNQRESLLLHINV